MRRLRPPHPPTCHKSVKTSALRYPAPPLCVDMGNRAKASTA
jgi:hypothetical protein